MKYLAYVLKNIRRNPVRAGLTAASIAICIALMVSLASFFAITNDVAADTRQYDRIVSMSSAGFAGRLPIKAVGEIAALKGIVAATPFSWFGGKYNNQPALFAQFGVDPTTIFQIYDELTIPSMTDKEGKPQSREAQLATYASKRNSCAIGIMLAEDLNLKIGDRLPLGGDIYPVNLDLEIAAIYDGPAKRDRRMVMFHWEYLNELLKAQNYTVEADNAGAVIIKCENAQIIPGLIKQIDDSYRSSDAPTKTQTEEAFVKQFSEMMGNLQDLLLAVGFSVVLALLLVSGNAMAMSLRERTTEIAVLKAIGFSKPLVLVLILAESMLVAGIGGLIGAGGMYALFRSVDAGKISPFLNGFYILEPYVIWGIASALVIGLLSGMVPAMAASRLSVIQGLRKVV